MPAPLRSDRDIDALLVRLRTNFLFNPYSVRDEQLGLLYIATHCNRLGARVRVLDEPNLTLETLEGIVADQRIPVLGFFCDHENVMAVMSAVRQLKRGHPDLLCVAGGPQPTAVPWDERILRDSPCDIAVRGEGEFTFHDILRAHLQGELPLQDIQGITYRANGRIRRNPGRPPIKDLGALAMPDRELQFYPRPLTGTENLITSRGCPYRCAFCFEGQRHSPCRPRPVADVIAEVEMLLEKRRANYIAILDDVFTLSPRRVFEVCAQFQELQKKHRPFRWFCEGRANTLGRHPDMIAAMVDAGLIRLQIGVETGSQLVLDKYEKGITLDDIRTTVAACYREDLLSVVGNFIIGGACESWDTIRESIVFAHELLDLAPGCYDVNTTIYTPYPATRMYSEPREYDMEPLDLDCVTGPGDHYPFMRTSALSKWEVLHARHLFLESVEQKALSLLPRISDHRAKRHFEAFNTLRMNTTWYTLLSNYLHLYNYYGMQVAGGKTSLASLDPAEIESYKPVRTAFIGASHQGQFILDLKFKAIRFSKLGGRLYEYCYGKLTVREITDRLLQELSGKVERTALRDYVVRMLNDLDREKLLVFSRI